MPLNAERSANGYLAASMPTPFNFAEFYRRDRALRFALRPEERSLYCDGDSAPVPNEAEEAETTDVIASIPTMVGSSTTQGNVTTRNARPKKVYPYFTAEFRRYITIIRDSHGSSRSVATIIHESGGVSEFTLKKALKGEKIGERSINKIATVVFPLDPLSVIEFKIRHVENRIQRYLVQKPPDTPVPPHILKYFFERRILRNYSPQGRMANFFSKALEQNLTTGTALSGLSPIDNMILPVSTVTAVCGGARGGYDVFRAVCNRLNLSRDMLQCARILYFEKQFESSFLGSDESLFYDFSAPLPRVRALLEFSTKEALYLA